MKKFVAAAILLSACADAAVVISRPVTISRPIAVSRPAPQIKSNVSNTALGAVTAAAMVVSVTAANAAHSQTVPVADEDADTRLANVNVPLLTICSEDQFVRAVLWQDECKAMSSDAKLGLTSSCASLSYQRFCEPATLADIKGKRPARPYYTNTYMR